MLPDTPTPEFTSDELTVVELARQLRNDEIGFVDLASSGRAFTLTVGIPLAASRLAQLTHAPRFDIQLGPLISPELSRLPARWTDMMAYDLPAAGFIDARDNIKALLRGRVDVAFVSTAQIDQFGNLNITRVRGPGGWRRLAGALALPELLAFARRRVVIADLTPRRFVPKVDFVTCPGLGTPGSPREENAGGAGGPVLVLTDVATFEFAEQNRHMRLRSVHPGVSVDTVLGQMSFRPDIPAEIPRTVLPTQVELDLLRTHIDPDRALLAARTRP